MPWNWELPHWPTFSYNPEKMVQKEKQFLLGAGRAFALIKNIQKEDYSRFVVEILSMEGMESSKIEGEILDRESLQSSIKKHFGLSTERKNVKPKESGMAQLLCEVYETYDSALTQEMLEKWHLELFQSQSTLEDKGKYRSHPEPMQIVSSRYGANKVFFEAPPSVKVPFEMKAFTHWFNKGRSEPILARAALAHVYFESIHPFEDGNGRIGRLLVEKVLSQGIGHPLLIAVSRVLENKKKEYYASLEKCNKTLKVGAWVEFFADCILEAQLESMALLNFLIEKSKVMTALSGKINPRQEKVMLRMFAEGFNGFKGGLSAENYIAITKTSRATATRDLTQLVEIGALVKTGELRHTRYWLKCHLQTS